VACAGAVWLWPGVPLTGEFDGAIRPLPRNWTDFWVSKLHGFEPQHKPLQVALDRAAERLSADDEAGAQHELDAIGAKYLSPEGAVLMRAVAKRLGISFPDIPVGTRSLPWGLGNLGAQLSLFDTFSKAAFELEKEWDEGKHPRWPSGSTEGVPGRFRPTNGGAGQTTDNQGRPGIGHNGGPPLDDPPEIPEERPSTGKLRNAIIKGVARWALRRGLAMLIPGVGEVMGLFQLAEWIHDSIPYIDAYLSKPKTLDELNADANDPQDGYDVHHIVEQTPARNNGFPESMIESPGNRVRISTLSTGKSVAGTRQRTRTLAE
jgi:hypothetical protein